MSENAEEKMTLAEKNAARLERMVAYAIWRSVRRLKSITSEEEADNQAIERAARTALGFLRLAIDAQRLLVSIDKENPDDDSADEASRAHKKQIDDILNRIRERDAASGDGADARGRAMGAKNP